MKKIALVVMALVVVSGLALFTCGDSMATRVSEAKVSAVRERCDTIREDLKALQRNDSRARVYLGRYYETILSHFIVPLNVRLVSNNLSSAKFIDSQNSFSKVRTSFTIDYIEYQKELEDLVLIDCKTEPERFYEKLVSVRVRRAVVEDETMELRKLAESHMGLVSELEKSL